MVKKLILISTLLFAAILIMGCTSQQAQNTQTTEQTQAETTKAPELNSGVRTSIEVPLYQAPLDKTKINLSCETDKDCKLVKAMGGAGEIQECIGASSEYDGEETDLCICKYISDITSIDSDGNEVVQKNYECRHIA